MRLIWSLLLFFSSYAFAQGEEQLQLPPRPANALSGTAFLQKIMNYGPSRRETAILREILKGNVPEFIRTLTPVEMQLTSGPKAGETLKYWILPDYLAVGSDEDFVRVPLNLHTIAKLNEKLNVSLPTVKMVDDIYAKAAIHVSPKPIPCKTDIAATANILKHNELLLNQIHDYTPGMLIAGHKKDVVQSRRLLRKPQAIAIYGWHRSSQDPIQPLSTVHSAEYADYSHGIRLVSNHVEINGEAFDLRDMLESRTYAPLLSNEGPIPQNFAHKAGKTLLTVASHP